MSNHLSVDELAQQLGVTKQTLYNWAKERKIPYVKLPSNDIRFNADHINQWLANRTVKQKNRTGIGLIQ